MKGTVDIQVSKDMMSVKAVMLPKGNGEITGVGILDMLNAAGIKEGIKYDLIKEIIKEEPIGQEYIIAEGTPAIQGKKGYFEYKFNITRRNEKPTVVANGTVDYMADRQIVEVGDLVAVYHPAKPGVMGNTVFSGIVAPVPVREMLQHSVQGVQQRGNKYFATVKGAVSLQGNDLIVMELLEIEGNVTSEMGNITHNGDIHIKGDVAPGAFISAKGTIIVDGIIEGAQLEAGQDIVSKSGIYGKKESWVCATGSVYAPIIEDASVVAGVEIKFDTAYNSTLSAREQIVAEGRRGSVIGGECISNGRICVRTAGDKKREQPETILHIIDRESDVVSPECGIIIEDKAYMGAKLCFGEVYHQEKVCQGEFHFLNDEVIRCDIGGFNAEIYKRPEKTAEIPTILLVDDEPMLLKTFFGYLSKDYRVMAANSAKDAISVMEKVLPDLILLDYNMPDMNGGEMLDQMRKDKNKWYHNVPVIFATAVTEQSVVLKCLSLYPQGYVIKPLGKEELLEVVAKFFVERGV